MYKYFRLKLKAIKHSHISNWGHYKLRFRFRKRQRRNSNNSTSKCQKINFYNFVVRKIKIKFYNAKIKNNITYKSSIIKIRI